MRTAINHLLTCAHCGAKFTGTLTQAKHVKYENKSTYCSAACRFAAASKRAQEQAVREGKTLRSDIPLAGPCPVCGEMFRSRTAKIFCSLKCYVKSPQFREQQLRNMAAGHLTRAAPPKEPKPKKYQDVPCLECGTLINPKPNGRYVRKFCSRTCYRAYMAKRFDRHIANPETLALPQCYDEFLNKEELHCMVEGCGWRGLQLSTHMNQAHGMKAEEFKRAAGFNLSTGVIARPLAEVLRERSCVGIALDDEETRAVAHDMAMEALKGKPIYHSLEGKEHARKTRALHYGMGPERTCVRCGKVFQQKTLSGRAIYCPECRPIAYAEQKNGQQDRRNARDRARRKAKKEKA